MSETQNQNKKEGIGRYFQFGEVLGYFFRKKDPNRKENFNLKAMHWTNKISIMVFLIFLIVWSLRRIMELF